MPRIFLSTAIAIAVSACADLPDLDTVLSDSAKLSDYPTLQPIQGLLARAEGTGTREVEEESDILKSRVAALKRKAARLRKPVLTKREHRKLAGAVARHST